jgi:hypothetical protein
MNQRFTIDGSPALEHHLAATCERVSAGIRSVVPPGKLVGILLGGGYGRGEGGVLRTPTGDGPYNDLEFYVFLRGNAFLSERKYRAPLHALGEQLSPAAGLEVEFKVLSLDKLRHSSPSMFYYDLVSGHRRVLGEETLLRGCEHHLNAAAIPLHEATRLLFNRCSGLLYSLERLQREDFGPMEADFVGRNIAKAQLAMGDVLLCAKGQYHWSCRERQERLTRLELNAELQWAEPLKINHKTGVHFKLFPARSTEARGILAARHTEISGLGWQLWLWLESKRLGQSFTSPRDYAFSETDKCPETSSSRNRLINLRTFGLSAPVCGRYPRERLFHALTLMLWEKEALKDPLLLGKIQTELQSQAHEFKPLALSYERLWNRFN